MNTSHERSEIHLDQVIERKDIPSRMIVDESILLDPETRQVLILNEVGGVIWSLIDGKRTVREIVTMITQRYNVDWARAEADVVEFLREMQMYNLINFKNV